MLIRIMLTLLFSFLLVLTSHVVLAEGSKYKFGKGFKLKTPAEIYPEQFLNVKSHNKKDNSTVSNIDPIKNTFKLNILKNEDKANNIKIDDTLSFKKIEETPAGSNPMFPDKEFRGSYRPDSVGTALGLTIGK